MLKQLCEISSPASGEEKIKEFIISELKEYTDAYYIDNFGNLIFEKKGSGEKTVVECGIDEPFLMATDGEEDKIRFSAPPHFTAKSFVGEKVVSADGAALEIMNDLNEDEKCKFSNLYAQKYEKSPECGELFTILPQYFESKNRIVSKNLIYKAPIYAVINAVKGLKDNNKNLCFLFSVNKCLAARGLRAFLTDNEVSSVLSVACTKENDFIESGEGAIICAKEKSCVPTVSMRKNLCEIAEKNEIDYSAKIFSENHNLKSVLTTAGGSECGLLGIVFKENESNGYEIMKNDIKNVTKLIISYCKE